MTMPVKFLGLAALSVIALAAPCSASGGGHGAAESHAPADSHGGGGDHGGHGGGDAHGGGGHGGHGAAEPVESDVSEESKSGFRGIKLGEFQIRTSNAVLSRKDHVTFILHARVKNEDYAKFDGNYRNHKNKVRDQVVIATRLVPIEDYDDPELKQFRRRILLRLRRALPELPIQDVVISDFALSIEST
jgi:hypothetical protein